MCGDTYREKAKGATFFEATEGETVRPMLDVAWAPMLGAFSVLFEEFPEGEHTTRRTLLPSLCTCLAQDEELAPSPSSR